MDRGNSFACTWRRIASSFGLVLEMRDGGGSPEPSGLSPRDVLARAEHLADVERMRRASILALVAWPAFGLVDLFMVAFVHPGRFWVFLLLRLAGLVFLVPATVRLHSRPLPTPELLRLVDVLTMGTLSALVGISSVEAGGLASPLCLGVMTILIARSAVLSDRATRAFPPVLAGALAYPVAVLSVSFVSPALRAQFGDTRAVGTFLLGQLFIAGAAALTLVGGEMVSTLRRRLHESHGLGRYRLERRIGKGGFGEVWAAVDRKLERPVALKILKPLSASATSAAERFEREIRATAELAHPHTVRLFDHGVGDDGLRYYVMELLDGQNLGQLVEEAGPLRAGRAVELVRQAAAALGEAHRRGIVHRDVKPQNLFVTSAAERRDFVKVLDFGLAQGAADLAVTVEGCAAGSPSYIAPEVLRGLPADARSDVYGLGCVLYFLLVGRPPFVGADARQILLGHMHQPAEPPSRFAMHEVPAELDALVLRCLAKDPANRPADAVELFDELARFLRTRAAQVFSRPSRPTPMPAPVPADPDAAAVRAPSPPILAPAPTVIRAVAPFVEIPPGASEEIATLPTYIADVTRDVRSPEPTLEEITPPEDIPNEETAVERLAAPYGWN